MARTQQPRQDEVLYAATNRHVIAFSATTGEEIWRTKLQGAQSGVLGLLVRGERLFAAGSGQLYCLARASGEVLWSNDLPKLGYQPVMLAMEGTDTSAQSLAAQVELLARQAEAAATTVM